MFRAMLSCLSQGRNLQYLYRASWPNMYIRVQKDVGLAAYTLCAEMSHVTESRGKSRAPTSLGSSHVQFLIGKAAFSSLSLVLQRSISSTLCSFSTPSLDSDKGLLGISPELQLDKSSKSTQLLHRFHDIPSRIHDDAPD